VINSVIKVTHIIAGLQADGAETVLHAITSRMDRNRFHNEVISLTDRGVMAERLEAAGISVRTLGMRPGVPNPIRIAQLARLIKASKPSVVQTWMYHADLLGGLAARLGGSPRVVWGIHHSNLDPGQNKRTTIMTAQACAKISGVVPSRIICCSEAARVAHIDFGYAAEKMEVIPNGFDLKRFHPDPEARNSLRRELGVPNEATLIGMAARFHVQKGHKNFVEAASRLHAAIPDVRFLLCGKGADPANSELMGWIQSAGASLVTRFHLLGARNDMARIFAALDISTSASISEAFPMAVGEAMSCGTPCVVSDVGDSALIVGDTGRVVPPSDPERLSDAWKDLLTASETTLKTLGQAARTRVEQNFSIDAIVQRYQQVYQKVTGTNEPAFVQEHSVASVAR
jgi:glycosyltransferase involved in cell wall biosynthesis